MGDHTKNELTRKMSSCIFEESNVFPFFDGAHIFPVHVVRRLYRALLILILSFYLLRTLSPYYRFVEEVNRLLTHLC
jgi:hypothetical protein